MPTSYIQNLKNLRKITMASITYCQKAIWKYKGKLNLAIKFLINKSNFRTKHSLKESLIVCRRNKTKKKFVMIQIATETEFLTKTDKLKILANLLLEVALFCQRFVGNSKSYVLKYQILPNLPLFQIITYLSNYIFNEDLELKTIYFLEAHS